LSFGGVKGRPLTSGLYLSAIMMTLVQALAHELKYPTKTVPTLRPAGPTSDAGPNVFDTLFGLEMESE